MHLGTINQQLSIHRPTTTVGFIQLLNQYPFTGAARPRDVTDFLQLAVRVCNGANAAQMRAAIRVLAKLPLPESAFFPRLNMNKVMYDVLRRILEPRLIGQGPYGLCGPATFALLLAKTRPVDYATLAVRLARFGKGTINGLAIEPNAHVREHDPDDTISDGDWLIEASIRNSDDALSESIDLGHYGGTHPGLMFEWLKKSGYGTVVSIPSRAMANAETTLTTLKSRFASWLFLNYHPEQPTFLNQYTDDMLTDPLGNLPLAQRFCNNGWKVLLMITEALAGTTGGGDPVEARVAAVGEAYTYMRQQVPPEKVADARKRAVAALVGDKGANHWVLAKRISTDGGKVRVTRYSWGTKETTSPIDFEIFFQVYGGFLAVNERDPLQAAGVWK